MSALFRQVALERKSDHGRYVDIAWIDEALARVGKHVRCEDGTIWEVVEIYGSRRREFIEGSRAARKHFAAVGGSDSDDEQPDPEPDGEVFS